MGVNTLVKTIVSGAKAHKSEIMIGSGLVSGAGAIFMAIKETPKCLEAYNKAEAEMPTTTVMNGDEEVEVKLELDWKTKLLIFGKYYWPTLVLEGASIFLIIWGTKIRLNSYTALAAVYGLTKAELEDIKQVISEQPENWKKKFTEKMAESHLEHSDPEDIPEPKMSNTEVPMPLPLFWDDQARVYFRMSEGDLRDALAEFTNMINTDPFQATSMNDWMRLIEHEEVVNGEYYLMSLSDADWDGALKYQQIGVKEAPNGEPARMMRFSKEYHLDTRGMYSEV